MRKVFFLNLLSFFVIFIVIACTNSDKVEPILAENNNEVLAKDSLFIKLQNINDSLLKVSQNDTAYINKSRTSTKTMLEIAGIVLADIEGASKGAKWGSKFGFIGSVIGAVIGAVGYSAAAAAYYIVEDIWHHNDNKNNITQEQIELAYVNALLLYEPVSRNDEEYVPAINIPKEYEQALAVGKYHNAALRVMDEDLPLVFTLEDGLSQEEINILHSEYYTTNFNYAIHHPEEYSWSTVTSNLSTQERVVQLFVEAYKINRHFANNIDSLINLYIDIIESDAYITSEEKEHVYYALATAAYSNYYWTQRYENAEE